MKTIKEWFASVRDPTLRVTLLSRLDPLSAGCRRSSLASALGWGFIWETTPEGAEYWRKLGVRWDSHSAVADDTFSETPKQLNSSTLRLLKDSALAGNFHTAAFVMDAFGEV